MPSRTEIVQRALLYPYEMPREAYVLIDGEVRELLIGRDNGLTSLVVRDGSRSTPLAELLSKAGEPLEQRAAVIGYGSNASPSQLRRKFAGAGIDCVIPVLKARLRDHDVVFSAHVSVYGAVPATIHPSPETVVDVVVTLLSESQLVTMFDSEGGNYAVRSLDPESILSPVELDFPRTPQAYVSRFGALALDGAPVALSAVSAESRVFDQLAEPQMLERVVAVLEPSMTVADFILECNANEPARVAWVDRLKRWALLDTPPVDAHT